MCQNHSPAAVTFELKFIQRITLSDILRQKFQIRIPFIPDNFTSGKAPYWDDHDGRSPLSQH